MVAEWKEFMAEVNIEPLDQFQQRMTKQFQQQLTDYMRGIRESFVYDSRPQLSTHAAWTALALAGVSIAKISRADEWTKKFNKGEPESTVGKAVSRFSNYIELTLPKRFTCGDSLTWREQNSA